ncbi:MAG: hypothetical protein E7278_02305 [Lachnospiraceae bacterium]|nr:hypothetical protein [Lachnospiraceae bacterium]
MIKEVIWSKEINNSFLKSTYSWLGDFLSAVDLINNQQVHIVGSNTIDYDDRLWAWLYDKTDSSLVDIKRELVIKLSRITKISEKEYAQKYACAGENAETKELILSDGTEEYKFCSEDGYYCGLRYYLKLENKNDFGCDLLECFPNIYFTDNIASSLNSLNSDFESIREEIVDHLIALNNYKAKFEMMIKEHRSNVFISAAFKADTGIDCSPQSNRDTTKQLRACFYNAETGENETVICELHTKFKKFNRDKFNQDRIYFFPGKNGILGGKIIVRHIGKHL